MNSDQQHSLKASHGVEVSTKDAAGEWSVYLPGYGRVYNSRRKGPGWIFMATGWVTVDAFREFAKHVLEQAE